MSALAFILSALAFILAAESTVCLDMFLGSSAAAVM